MPDHLLTSDFSDYKYISFPRTYVADPLLAFTAAENKFLSPPIIQNTGVVKGQHLLRAKVFGLVIQGSWV